MVLTNLWWGNPTRLMPIAALTLLAAACGGATSSQSPTDDPVDGGQPVQDAAPRVDAPPSVIDGATPDVATAGDSGAPADAAPASAVCPATPSSPGETCTVEGVECEYGTSPEPGCNTILQCKSGAWSDEGAGGGQCPAGVCPASFAAASGTGACPTTPLGCSYPEGDCYCSTPIGFPPPDAAELVPVWQCVPKPEGCPAPRPLLGATCTENGKTCDYGGCAGGATMSCQGSIWTRAMPQCPQG